MPGERRSVARTVSPQEVAPCRSPIWDSAGDARPPAGDSWTGERTPPHDLLAEQSALGGMLLSKDAVADVIETVRGVDFYIPKHEVIFDAILTLYSHGEPTDVIAVTDELTKTGQLQRAGGAEYLHTLTGLVPTAANAGYYASIVAEKAVLRRLVEAGTRIVQMGYASEGEVTDLVNNAQAEIYGVTGGVESEDYVPLVEAVDTAVDEIERARGRDGEMAGVPTGFAELDELTNGLHGGQLIIVAARPGLGKSTLALDFARSATIKHDLPAIFFSLEMGRSEIAMRLLAAEASIAHAQPAQGQHGAARLDQDRQRPRPDRRRPALHRRQPEHDPGRDPRQVPPAQPAGRAEDGRHRLPAADDLRQEGRVAPAGGQRVLAGAQAARQRAQRAGHRALAAQPRPRAARRQEARPRRPARVGFARAGRRHRDPAAPRRRLRARRTRARARPT